MVINNASDALMPSVLGMIIVFFMLVLIMLVIYAIAAIFKPKLAAAVEVKPEPIKVIEPDVKKVAAKGSLGEIKLFDTSEKDAAMVMAIVADKLQAPLNTLRFKSIRRIS